MSEEEKTITETVYVDLVVEKPLAYCKITGLTVPEEDEKVTITEIVAPQGSQLAEIMPADELILAGGKYWIRRVADSFVWQTNLPTLNWCESCQAWHEAEKHVREARC